MKGCDTIGEISELIGDGRHLGCHIILVNLLRCVYFHSEIFNYIY